MARPWIIRWGAARGTHVLAESAPSLDGYGGWSLIDGGEPQPEGAERAEPGWYEDDTEGGVMVTDDGFYYGDHRPDDTEDL